MQHDANIKNNSKANSEREQVRGANPSKKEEAREDKINKQSLGNNGMGHQERGTNGPLRCIEYITAVDLMFLSASWNESKIPRAL
jgi:hypothetical protein